MLPIDSKAISQIISYGELFLKNTDISYDIAFLKSTLEIQCDFHVHDPQSLALFIREIIQKIDYKLHTRLRSLKAVQEQRTAKEVRHVQNEIVILNMMITEIKELDSELQQLG